MRNNTLPSYQGPFPVGFVDIEQSTSPSNLDHPGVLMRIYYPAVVLDAATPSTSNWLPDNWNYSKGYGHFLHVPFIAIALFIYPNFCFTKKRALPHPLIEDGQFPICLFSHGLGGMRTTYSQLCGNLASRGVIVVAIEHGDQSAAYTSRLNGKVKIPYHHPTMANLLEGEEVLDGHLRIRGGQVQQRSDECLEAMKVMKELNVGKLDSLIPLQNDEAKRAILQLKDRMDFNESIIIGHSFGGATTIKVLDPSTDCGIDFKCAVLLDPWMFPVQECKIENIPVLNLQSHHFHWSENLDSMKKLAEGTKYHTDSIFGHIRDTSHQDACDIPMLFPFVMRKLKRSGPSNPKIAQVVQDRIIVEFVSKYVKLHGFQLQDKGISIESHASFGERSWLELRASLKTSN